MESIAAITSVLEKARDLTLEAAQSAGAAGGLRNNTVREASFSQVQKLLASRNDREILDGLRKVISLIYSGKPGLPYFSSVVKTVANPNVEIKKLVYIYLLHYAESDPDLALLSVNAIQKSLTDQSPQVRAMALRTMSGMRVPVISQIVSLAIKRASADSSPHVRKAAALAISKCYRLDPGTLPQLVEYLSTLLGDKQYFVVGPAVSAFLEICPEKIELIHKHYRDLVRKLVDMDEWSQLAALRLLINYSRRCFPRKTIRVTQAQSKGFYDDEPAQDVETGEEKIVLDPDLQLFLKACKSLLYSRSSAVIMGVVSCFIYLGTDEHLADAVGPLMALVRSSPDIQQIALHNIISIALRSPTLFVPYTSHFLISASDPSDIWHLKIELQTLLFPHCTPHLQNIILLDLEHFAHSPSPDLIRASVHAIGRCAHSPSSNQNNSSNKTSTRCFRILISPISTDPTNTVLVSSSLTVIRHLIQQSPSSHVKTVIRLAKNLDLTTSPEARASIIWLVGEFAALSPGENIAADVCRILAGGFSGEEEGVRGEILLLAAKVYLQFLLQRADADADADPSSTAEADSSEESGSVKHPIPLLYAYIHLLIRYDTSFSLRDRARTLKALLPIPYPGNPLPTREEVGLASLLLLATKPVPVQKSIYEGRKGGLGSCGLVLGQGGEGKGYGGWGKGWEVLEWVDEGEEPDARLRDGDGDSEGGGRRGVDARGTGAGKMLDEALAREKQNSRTGAGAGARKIEIGAGSSDKGKGLSLDDWLDQSDSGETESGTDSGEEEDEEGETEEETDEEGSSEEEDDDAGSERAAGPGEKDRLMTLADK